MDHDEETKRIRRKIEEKLRKEFTKEKIFSLATLLEIDVTQQEKKQQQ